ncbi:hypothetical protein QQX98_009219 [Neonectria punicea]|uniref:Ig-like domain-containing protein n=1 Tax=Neonectria punicea TaxID=979145 RepID=A0ABR1GSW7_9HYPO
MPRITILKQSRTPSPPIVADNYGVIIISDDESDDSNDSNDDYEFEDVPGFDAVANVVEHIEARPEGLADEKARDDETTHDVINDSATDAFTSEDESACEIGDEHVTKAATPYIDAAVEVLDELAALRSRVTRLEAQVHLGDVACKARSTKKRKRSTSKSPYTRRLKGHLVNISATRAYIYWDDTSERCAYTWRRGRGGHCWVKDEELELDDREEVDGGYLLCYATNLSVEIRANADWLPIEVRLNKDTQVFEGMVSIGSCRLEIGDSVMIDMMSGGKGKHAALVFY